MTFDSTTLTLTKSSDGVSPARRPTNGLLQIWLPIWVGLLVGATALLATAYVSWRHQTEFIEHSERVSAKVVGFSSLPRPRVGSVPVFAYQFNGVDHRWHANSGGIQKSPTYRTGDTVMVYVDRDHPDSILIDTFDYRWGRISLLFVANIIVIYLLFRLSPLICVELVDKGFSRRGAVSQKGT